MMSARNLVGKQTALHLAAWYGQAEAVQYLLSGSSSSMMMMSSEIVNAPCRAGWGMLHYAVHGILRGRGEFRRHKVDEMTQFLDILFEHGANVNQADRQGFTPLCQIANSVKYETLLLMLNPHYVTLRDANEWSTWSTGNMDPHIRSVLQLLIRKGADTEWKTKAGKSVSDLAFYMRDIDSIPPG